MQFTTSLRRVFRSNFQPRQIASHSRLYSRLRTKLAPENRSASCSLSGSSVLRRYPALLARELNRSLELQGLVPLISLAANQINVLVPAEVGVDKWLGGI
ncbi:hypothetical protein [Hydrogenophaga sp.]